MRRSHCRFIWETGVPFEPRYLQIRETGKRMVVAFRPGDTWDFQFLAHCADELDHVVEHFAFETLALDLANVDQISSTLIGVFVSLKRSGIGLELLNPSPQAADVLETMHLEGLIADNHRLQSE